MLVIVTQCVLLDTYSERRRYMHTRLCGVTFTKTILFILVTARGSNLAYNMIVILTSHPSTSNCDKLMQYLFTRAVIITNCDYYLLVITH